MDRWVTVSKRNAQVAELDDNTGANIDNIDDVDVDNDNTYIEDDDNVDEDNNNNIDEEESIIDEQDEQPEEVREELLRQKVNKGGVTISRVLQEGTSSSASRARKQQKLKNTRQNKVSGSHDYGSREEVIKRHKENNRDTPDPRDDNPIRNDKTLITKILNGIMVLYCTVCKTHVNANKRATAVHLLSGGKPRDTRGHIYNMNKFKSEETIEMKLSRSFEKWFKNNDNVAGIKNVGIENNLFRIQAVYHFLKAGIPLSGIDSLRTWLEEGFDKKLVVSNRLRSFIPVIASSEDDSIKALIKECVYCTVIFDGTTRVDEILCIVFRFVTTDFKILHKLVSLKRYDSCKSSEQLSQEDFKIINNRYKIDPPCIVSFQKDRASANEAIAGIVN